MRMLFLEVEKECCLGLWLAVLSKVKLQIPCPQLVHKPPLIKLISHWSERKERELCWSSGKKICLSSRQSQGVIPTELLKCPQFLLIQDFFSTNLCMGIWRQICLCLHLSVRVKKWGLWSEIKFPVHRRGGHLSLLGSRVVRGSQRCSSQPLSSAQRWLLACLGFWLHCAAHACSGAVWLGCGESKKALAAFTGLKNSCTAPWPPEDALRAPLPLGMFCGLASSASASPSNLQKQGQWKILMGVVFSCLKSLWVLPRLAEMITTPFCLFWPCEPPESLSRVRGPENPVLET